MNYLATAGAGGSAGILGMLLPFVFMIGIFYLLIFLPENKRKKKYSSMISALKVNDEVITKGGIIGRIVNIQDDFVIVESGPDRMRIKLDKNGVLNIINKEETAEESKEKSKEK